MSRASKAQPTHSATTEPNTPTRARTSRRPAWKPIFIEVLSHTANVTTAAKAAGVNRSFAYEAKGKDPVFAAQWQEAWDSALDLLEQEAWRRAVQGVRKPVFQGGKRVGWTREFSDALLQQLLKGHLPARYRERVQVEQTRLAEGMSDADTAIIKSLKDLILAEPKLLKEILIAEPKLREVLAQQLLADPEFVTQLANVVPAGQVGARSPDQGP